MCLNAISAYCSAHVSNVIIELQNYATYLGIQFVNHTKMFPGNPNNKTLFNAVNFTQVYTLSAMLYKHLFFKIQFEHLNSIDHSQHYIEFKIIIL